MRLVRIPGVFAPISDTRLLGDCLRRELRPGATVADVCTGSGALAVLAALSGAAHVTAVDVSRRAVLTTRINARLNGDVVASQTGPLGPLLRGRVELLERDGRLAPGVREEEVVAIRGRRMGAIGDPDARGRDTAAL